MGVCWFTLGLSDTALSHRCQNLAPCAPLTWRGELFLSWSLWLPLGPPCSPFSEALRAASCLGHWTTGAVCRAVEARAGSVARQVPRALSWQAESKPGSSSKRTVGRSPAPITRGMMGDTASKWVTRPGDCRPRASRKLQFQDSWGRPQSMSTPAGPDPDGGAALCADRTSSRLRGAPLLVQFSQGSGGALAAGWTNHQHPQTVANESAPQPHPSSPRLSGWYCDSWGCRGRESHPPPLTVTPAHPAPPHAKGSVSFTSVFLPPASSQTHGWAQLPVRTGPAASAQGIVGPLQGPPSLSSAWGWLALRSPQPLPRPSPSDPAVSRAREPSAGVCSIK